MAKLCRFCKHFVECAKTFEKLRFSVGVSRISGVGRVSKSMKILEKSIPECFGKLKNRRERAGLFGLAMLMAVGQENRGQKRPQTGKTLSELPTAPRPQATGKG